MESEARPDLIPSSCKRCVAEVVAGVHNGVPVYWVQHGTDSTAVTMTGAEVEGAMTDMHNTQFRARLDAALAKLGKPNVTALTQEEAKKLDELMAGAVEILPGEVADDLPLREEIATNDVEGAPV